MCKVFVQRFFLCLIPFIIITSCKENHILSEAKLEAVLHDIYLAESMYDVKRSAFVSDDQKKSLYTTVLNHHGITKEQFDSSLVWYSDNAQLFIRVSDSVVSSLRANLSEVNQEYTLFNDRKNKLSDNYYPVPAYYYLSYYQPVFRFYLDSAEVVKYPKFELDFTTLGVLPEDSLEITLKYTCADTIIIKEHLLTKNKKYELKSRSYSTFKDLKSISGYIYVDPKKICNRNILIQDLSLR